jgi:hypothetical protein
VRGKKADEPVGYNAILRDEREAQSVGQMGAKDQTENYGKLTHVTYGAIAVCDITS